MVDCETFLAEYSALCDGVLPEELSAALEAHRDGCPSCARYDRVVRSGAALARQLPELEVSDDFMARLEGRLHQVDLELAAQASQVGAGAATVTLSVAALIAVAAWIPVVSFDPAGSAAGRTAVSAATSTLQLAVSPDTQFDTARPGGLAAQLMALGVLETPYSNLLFRDSPLASPVAALTGPDGGALALSPLE